MTNKLIDSKGKNWSGERDAKHWGRTTSYQGRQLDKWLGKNRPALPICPYGCGEEGQLREVIIGEDGKAIGIFNDSDGCVFRAQIEVGEPPTKARIIIGPNGEPMEVKD